MLLGTEGNSNDFDNITHNMRLTKGTIALDDQSYKASPSNYRRESGMGEFGSISQKPKMKMTIDENSQ